MNLESIFSVDAAFMFQIFYGKFITAFTILLSCYIFGSKVGMWVPQGHVFKTRKTISTNAFLFILEKIPFFFVPDVTVVAYFRLDKFG